MFMVEIKIGSKIRGKEIKDLIKLRNGWLLLKTENGKSAQDFRVRLVLSIEPQRSIVPKHAHFAIDLFGKLCQNSEKARLVLQAIYEVWHKKPVDEVLKKYENETSGLRGYPLEYILYALNWIFDQEDINFSGRPQKKQKELDSVLSKFSFSVPPDRYGSELAMSLLCDIVSGTHPVDALLAANLDVVPRKRR